MGITREEALIGSAGQGEGESVVLGIEMNGPAWCFRERHAGPGRFALGLGLASGCTSSTL